MGIVLLIVEAEEGVEGGVQIEIRATVWMRLVLSIWTSQSLCEGGGLTTMLKLEISQPNFMSYDVD